MANEEEPEYQEITQVYAFAKGTFDRSPERIERDNARDLERWQNQAHLRKAQKLGRRFNVASSLLFFGGVASYYGATFMEDPKTGIYTCLASGILSFGSYKISRHHRTKAAELERN